MASHVMIRRTAVGMACVLALSGCASPTGIRAPFEENVPMVEGPAIEDIVTPFDRALACLDGRLSNKLTFSVGAILDSTGKEQLSDGGVGKFVTQGAGDIVQSALFQAGTTVLNRRDPRIMETETKWGLHSAKSVIPSMFFITGSINSLDFIPGGGFEAQVAGIGPRYRQHRILIGMDLSMTETKSGRIVANVPLHKQIVASEVGFGVGRFFGETLVSLDVGNQNREAVHFAMRQMLNLATFELLTQVMRPESYADCRAEIQSVHGVVGNTKTSKRVAQFLADRGAVTTAGAEQAAEPSAGLLAPAPSTDPQSSAPALAPVSKVPASVSAPVNAANAKAVATKPSVASVAMGKGASTKGKLPGAGAVVPTPAVSVSIAPSSNVGTAGVAVSAVKPVEPTTSAQPGASAAKNAAEPLAPAAPVLATSPVAAPAVQAPAGKASTKSAAPQPIQDVAAAETARSDSAGAAVPQSSTARMPAMPSLDASASTLAGGEQSSASTQQRYFVDEQASPSANAVRALDLPVKSAGAAEQTAADTPDSRITPQASGSDTAQPTAAKADMPSAAASSPQSPTEQVSAAPATPEKAVPVVSPGADASPVKSLAVTEEPPRQNAAPSDAKPDVAPSKEPLATPVAVQTSVPASKANAAAEPPKASALVQVKSPVPYIDRLIEPQTCVMPNGKHLTVQSPRASKDGGMVFVSAPPDTTLCVADSSGKLWSHRFELNKGRSFHGTPPWSLQSPYLNEMQIYFQGWKLLPIGEGVDRIRLVQRDLD